MGLMGEESIAQWRAREVDAAFARYDVRCGDRWDAVRWDRFAGELRGYAYEALHGLAPAGARVLDYLLTGDLLVVGGAWGDAVYRGVPPTLAAVARLEYDAFRDRCVASPVGTPYTEWDPELAWGVLQRHARTCAEECDPYPVFARPVVATREAWGGWLVAEGPTCFGPDWCDWCGIGERTHAQCVVHLGGLRLACGVAL